MVLFGFGKKETVTAVQAELPRYRSVSVSDRGKCREDNQDHVFADDLHGVYAVADGVGGGSEGAFASEIVCRNLKMRLAAEPQGFKALVSAVERAIRDANAVLVEERKSQGYEQMASTVAVLVLDPENPHHAAVGYVGDSRVYRISHGMPGLLTRDHRAMKGECLLLRAVGAADEIRTEWVEVDGGKARYVLCTDGVHDVMSQARLGVFAAAGAIEVAAERIKADVLKHGAPDNFSFILVET